MGWHDYAIMYRVEHIVDVYPYAALRDVLSGQAEVPICCWQTWHALAGCSQSLQCGSKPHSNPSKNGWS